MIVLQAKNVLNESSLVILQDKLEVILDTKAKGEDLQKILKYVRKPIVVDESGTGPCVYSRPLMNVESTFLSYSESKFCVIEIELETVISSVFNFTQCITKQPRNTQLRASEVHRLDAIIPEFVELVDRFLLGKEKIV